MPYLFFIFLSFFFKDSVQNSQMLEQKIERKKKPQQAVVFLI